MARFEHSRKRDHKGPSSRGARGGFKGRGDSGRGRDSGRSRREFEMTKVTCSSCGNQCEVPFKPTSNKPIYCDDCFAKKGKSNSSNSISERDLDMINEKLNKIMKALEIK